MAIPEYTLGFPPDGSNLGNTKAVIRDNLDGTFETLSVDHVDNNGIAQNPPISGQTAGYHTLIHQIKQTTTPMNISGINQFFCGDPAILINPNTSKANGFPSGDTQLFSLSAGNGFSQLTGNISNQNGYQWLGGVLLQWGFVAGSSPIGFAFNPAFPNNCFNVEITVVASGVSSNTVSLIGLPSQLGFACAVVHNAGSAVEGIFWIAIGN